MNAHRPLVLVPLSLLSALACGPGPSAATPLEKAGGLTAGPWFKVVHGRVTALGLSLTPASGCPTLDAVARMNGETIPVDKPGGERRGSYYFVPTTSCETPSYSASAQGTAGLLEGNMGPLEAVLEDSSATFRLVTALPLDNALTTDRAAYRGGEMIVFTPRHPLAGLEMAGLLTFREYESWDEVLGADVGMPTVSGGLLKLAVPRIPAGRYRWFLSVRGTLPAERCEGFASCRDVGAEVASEGVLELLP